MTKKKENKVTVYLDDETFNSLKKAKLIFAKKTKRIDADVSMSDYVRSILREYLNINKQL